MMPVCRGNARLAAQETATGLLSPVHLSWTVSLGACPWTIHQPIHHHAETASIADSLHRRRLHDQREAFLDRRELAEQGALDGVGRQIWISRTLGERIEHQKHRGGVG